LEIIQLALCQNQEKKTILWSSGRIQCLYWKFSQDFVASSQFIWIIEILIPIMTEIREEFPAFLHKGFKTNSVPLPGNRNLFWGTGVIPQILQHFFVRSAHGPQQQQYPSPESEIGRPPCSPIPLEDCCIENPISSGKR
jgi:hypothetical protein